MGLNRRLVIALMVVTMVTACTSSNSGPPGTSSSVPTLLRTSVLPSSGRPTTTTGSAGTTLIGTARSAGRSEPALPSSPAVAANGTCVAGHCYVVGQIHQLPVGVAPGSSGILASAKSPGVFFVVDDAAGGHQINAVRENGSLVADVDIKGMTARNAEALAAAPCGDRAGRCLYVGDIGDNALRRTHIVVYRLTEPSLSPAPSAPVPADAWDYSYPDGPHNAEAMVVEGDGDLLIITKSARNAATGAVPPHRIYRGAPGGGRLAYVSEFTPPGPVRPLQSLVIGTVVTDAAYSAGRMLILTYDQVIDYVAPTPTADPAGFPNWPHRQIPAPPMIQSEGITADISGCGYEVT